MKNIIPFIVIAVIIAYQQLKHPASASILWQKKYVNTSLRGCYKGKQFGDDQNTVVLDPYFTFDIQLFKQIKENFILSLDIQDVLEAHGND
jgi:hypothetical protein